MKRGVIETAFAVWLGCVVAMGVAAYQLRDSHRERKAIEFAQVLDGKTKAEAEAWVATLSKEEILDYIRDDDAVSKPQKNYGVGERGNF